MEEYVFVILEAVQMILLTQNKFRNNKSLNIKNNMENILQSYINLLNWLILSWDIE
jgi:hypothetical protein